MGGVLMGIGAGLNILGALGQYNAISSSTKSQEQLARQRYASQHQMMLMQTGFLMSQAQAMRAQSGAFMAQSAGFLQQAEIAKKTGEILQANELAKATQAEKEADEKARRSSELRRQFIGEGRTKFAANGVLLESRPQSSVSMWEQDETADLAYELQGIKQQRDNEVWGYVFTGNQVRLQGLYDAQGLKLQSDASRIEAGNSMLGAMSAIANARMAVIGDSMNRMEMLATVSGLRDQRESAMWGVIGSIGGSVANAGAYYGSKSTAAPKSVTYVGITNSPAKSRATTSQLLS